MDIYQQESGVEINNSGAEVPEETDDQLQLRQKFQIASE